MRIYNLSPFDNFVYSKQKKILISQLILIGVLMVTMIVFSRAVNVNDMKDNLDKPMKAKMKNNLVDSLVNITNVLQKNNIKNFELGVGEKQTRLIFMAEPDSEIIDELRQKFPKIMIEVSKNN